jgi:hypothetical protein
MQLEFGLYFGRKGSKDSADQMGVLNRTLWLVVEARLMSMAFLIKTIRAKAISKKECRHNEYPATTS